MTKLLKLAWRDIWRNRRRSLLTMGAIVFAVIIISMATSMQYGTFDAMEELVVRIYTGDLQVHRAGFSDEQTLSYSLQESEQDWAQSFEAYPWIEATSRRLTGYGLVSSDSSSAGAVIVGIEPETERQISTFANAPAEGKALSADDDHAVLLGRTLAKNLGVAVGDSVVVLTQGYHNVMGADLYRVKGLVGMGSPDIDRSMMIMPLADAQSLFSMEGRFTEIVLRTGNFRGAQAYASVLREALDQERYEAVSWKAMLPEIQQMRAFKMSGNYVFFLLLILLIGFEIFNTTTMSMMERVREFGMMMSIGMKPRQLSLLIALELAMKVVLALALGFLITFAAVMLLKDNPIEITGQLKQLYEDAGVTVSGIAFSASPDVFVMPLVSVAVIALLSMAYPILRMRRFSPVQALRTT